MIETTDESGDVFLGSGIVIANHEDTILIATAKHNVSSVDNDLYSNIKISFHPDLDLLPGLLGDSEVFFHPIHDLAIFAFSVEEAKSKFKKTRIETTLAIEDFDNIYSSTGHPSKDNKWDISDGLRLKSLQGMGSRDILTFHQSNVEPGYSGGPIFSSRSSRLAGLIYEVDKREEEVFAFRMDVILALAENHFSEFDYLIESVPKHICGDDEGCNFELPGNYTGTVGLTTQEMEFLVGDKMTITITGLVTVGQFVGQVGPNGRKTGALGISLSEYNIFRDFPHGSVAVGGLPGLRADSYYFCGEKYVYTFRENFKGMIKFAINDSEKNNNYGSFKVNIAVERK